MGIVNALTNLIFTICILGSALPISFKATMTLATEFISGSGQVKVADLWFIAALSGTAGRDSGP